MQCPALATSRAVVTSCREAVFGIVLVINYRAFASPAFAFMAKYHGPGHPA
jgi:hypothetical protein